MAIGHSVTALSSDDAPNNNQQTPSSSAGPTGQKKSGMISLDLSSSSSSSAVPVSGSTVHPSASNASSSDPTDAPDTGLSLTGVTYTDAVVRMAIGRIADNIGWNTIGSETLSILTEVTGQYIKSMGRNCMRFANMSGRTQVTLPDVGLAFNQLHFNLTGLQEYISCVHPHPVNVKVNRAPARLRPCNRIKFACHQTTDAPFGEDIEIGYAVTDSDEEDMDEDSDDSMGMSSAVGGGSGVSGGGDFPVTRKSKGSRVFRRSDYYEEWMPAFPESERTSAAALAATAGTSASTTTSLMDQNQNSQSSLKEGTSDSHQEAPSSGLKVSELETTHLSNIHLNSSGQIIAMNGVIPVEPDKSFPDNSGPESIFESDEEYDLTAAAATTAPTSTMTARPPDHDRHKPIDKLTIKNATSLTKSGIKGSSSSGGRKKADKILDKDGMGKKPKKLLIKVSGLMAGTPTASPNFHGTSNEPLPPEMEERMDSTIDDVIAAALSAPDSPKKVKQGSATKPASSARKKESTTAKKEKEYSSREFVESDDDSDDDEEDRESVHETRDSPSPPIIHKKDDRKVTDTIDSVIKSVMSKASPHHGTSPHRSPSSSSRSKHHITPERSTTTSAMSPARSATGSKVVTKAAAKHFPADSPSARESGSGKNNPINKIESEAAEILMAFSTKPVEGQSTTTTTTGAGQGTSASNPSRSSSPPSFSPFNLGKVLAAGAFASFQPNAAASAAVAPIQDMIGQTSDIHPFAPNPPPATSLPFKTLAMKKAFDNPIFASESASFIQKRPHSPASDSDDEEDPDPGNRSKKKQRTDEEEEEKRRKKEKKRKKKESRDKEKDKKKKDKKKEKTSGSEVIESSSSNIPKLSIKIPSKSSSSAIIDDSIPVPKSSSKSSVAKVKKEEGSKISKPAAATGCILISETIKQTSSTATTKKGKGVVKKEKKPAASGGKGTAGSKGKSGVKSDTVAGEENEDSEDKVWICPGCKSPDDGSPMIGCDNCEEWYHWTCVGIRKDPDEDSWFCPRCTEKQRKIEQGLQSRSVKKEKRKFDEVSKSNEDDEDEEEGRKKKKKKKTAASTAASNSKKTDKKKQVVASDESEDDDGKGSEDEEDDDDDEPDATPAAKKSASAGNVDNEWSCHSCTRVDESIPMIGCDSCDHWFHWSCVGIVVEPDKNQVWICSDCRRVKPLKKTKDKFSRKSGVT